MDPTCFVSVVQAGGGVVMVFGIFSWHTLGSIVPINHGLNSAANLSTVADHVLPFMAKIYHLLMATSSMVMHHAIKAEVEFQTSFMTMTMGSVDFNGFHSHKIRIQYSIFGIW